MIWGERVAQHEMLDVEVEMSFGQELAFGDEGGDRGNEVVTTYVWSCRGDTCRVERRLGNKGLHLLEGLDVEDLRSAEPVQSPTIYDHPGPPPSIDIRSSCTL